MSRGGRGGTSATGVRAIANVLGIARHEVGAFTQLRRTPPPTYPQLPRLTREIKSTTDMMYMTDLKQELLQRFHESVIYQDKRGKKEISRYTDKFRKVQKEPFEPQFSRIPAELNWQSTSANSKAVKRKRLDADTEAAKWAKYEEKEKNVADPEDEANVEEDNEEENERNPNADEDGEPLSDDDYLEEDNDYIHNYFDNGEGYGDSDDGLEEDNVY